MSVLKPRIFVKGLALIGILVVIATLFEVTNFRSMLDKSWIDTQIRGQGVSGELLFITVGALATAVAVPRQVVSFLGGYAFGFMVGGVLSVIATLGGCMLTFFFARGFGRGLVTARFSGKVRRIDDFIHDNTFGMTLLIRLLPLGSNMFTSLAAGVSSVRSGPFLLGSGLGFIPQSAIFALIGSGIGIDPTLRIGLGVVLFMISGALGVYLYRRFRHGHHLDAELEKELGVED